MAVQNSVVLDQLHYFISYSSFFIPYRGEPEALLVAGDCSAIRLSPSGLDSLASQTESGTVKSGLGAILAPSDLTAACNLLKLKIHLKP